jgi:Kelch motif
MDVEDRIRDAVKADRRAEPSLQFHGRVMSSLPGRTGGARRPAWASADFARFVGLAAVVALVVAAVGLPLMQSKPGIATPGESATSAAVETRSATAAPIGHFTPTGDMAMKGGGLATLLADGRVLVLGSPTPELYDPGTGKFSPTGSMSTSRGSESATRLLDGRVLIVGGQDGTDPFATAELYDPATGRFSPTGSMAIGRQGHTATLLTDGRVLIAGGYHSGMGAVVPADALASELGIARPSSWSDPVRLGSLASAELYDPKTGTFSATGSMAEGRDWATATLLSGGRVLVVGGLVDGTLTLSSAEVYDPATGTFSKTGSMPDRRVLSPATLLSDGRVLFSGGQLMNGGDTDLSSALLYDPQTGQFSKTGSMVEPRDSATATRLADGRVLVVGGFTRPSDMPATAKGPVLVSVASAELYDPGTGTFNDAGSMTIARAGHTATLLLDGRVLIAGGLNMTPTTADELGSAELYQP